MAQSKDSSILDLITCPVCHFIMSSPSRDPMIIINCGHTICTKCLSMVKSCPICNGQSVKAKKNCSIKNLLEFAFKVIPIPPKLDPIDISSSTETVTSFKGQPSECGPLCTFTKYPNTFLIQKFYHCEDCKLVGDLGCCEACAKRCHIGHKIYLDQRNSPISTICNCGAHSLTNVKCYSCRHEHELCTFLKTGKKFFPQDFYSCLTCGIVDGYGICGACARNCHYGHELIYKGLTSCFCDCREFNKKCMCQT